MISGIVTGILLASFLGITAWAWSSRQRARFDDASRLPLDDELAIQQKACCSPKSTIDHRPSEMP